MQVSLADFCVMLSKLSKINLSLFRRSVLYIFIMAFLVAAAWNDTETIEIVKDHPLTNEIIKFTGCVMYINKTQKGEVFPYKGPRWKNYPYLHNALDRTANFYYYDCKETILSDSIEYIKTDREFLVENVFLRIIDRAWFKILKYWGHPHFAYSAILRDIKTGEKYWIQVGPQTHKENLLDALRSDFKSKKYANIFQQIEKNGSTVVNVYILNDSFRPIGLSSDLNERGKQTKEFFEQLKENKLYFQKLTNDPADKFISMKVDAKSLLRLISAITCLKIEIRNAYEEKRQN
jgi:hypothetical protein